MRHVEAACHGGERIGYFAPARGLAARGRTLAALGSRLCGPGRMRATLRARQDEARSKTAWFSSSSFRAATLAASNSDTLVVGVFQGQVESHPSVLFASTGRSAAGSSSTPKPSSSTA
jgi:hypothetical protein